MLAIVGTVPHKHFPLIGGKVILEDNDICIQGKRVSVNRGTPALLAAAIKTGEALGQPPPFGYLVGDIGLGHGSRYLYEYLTHHLGESGFHTITFHYLQPDVDWHNRVLFAIEEMARRPILIADAGFMYAAKMSGQAQLYDLFTPDAGELAFMADETAPHPFYTRGFILHDENQVPDLIARAYNYNNAPRYLLVKGKRDYVANQQGILATIDRPMEETLEAIGGTGDTLTGIVTALIEAGMEIKKSAIMAACVNRLAGYYAKPSPATQVREIIRHIPEALEEILEKREEIHKQNAVQ
ncbi:MAG: sugar kinase [Deltaproteobacteria bacterium]|nr:sugar kinase [Deltaproteobacteria bacterium]MBW1928285.1 sugar kinase [Deltaproteobacteria bacterium]MBW2025043.1 sugar kinase [Deltaproteobacteria bacterium]MBW2124464.1 sugar kinase [Deltaproteobacteria bacterium]